MFDQMGLYKPKFLEQGQMHTRLICVTAIEIT